MGAGNPREVEARNSQHRCQYSILALLAVSSAATLFVAWIKCLGSALAFLHPLMFFVIAHLVVPHVRHRVTKLVLFLAGLMIPLAGVVFSLLAMVFATVGYDQAKPWRQTVDNPGGDFSEHTQLAWPEGAKVVRVGDTHGGFNGDGEFYLVFDVDRGVLTSWLSDRPPWGTAKWNAGPIPTEIGVHCTFGSPTHVCAVADVHGERYAGAPHLVGLLGSKKVFYVAKERDAGSIRWHNGDLLVIDQEAGRVWLSVWDF